MGLAPVLLLAATLPAGQPFSLPPVAALAAHAGDEAALKAAFLSSSGPELLEFFRKRAVIAPDPVHLAELLKQLGDPLPARRDQAGAELVCYGQTAVPLLRQAVNNAGDRDVVARARRCLSGIEGALGSNLSGSAVRLLALHKPPGTCAALLGFLPFAENEDVVGQIQAALLEAGRIGKPDPALVEALKDPVPVRRAVAAAVLARFGGQHALLRPLLKDPRPSVRLKVTLALIDNHDAEAVPALIDLLAELPGPQRREAETYLTSLAGEWAVVTPPGNDLLARRLRRELWTTWWNRTDGEALLREFRSRTLSDDDRAQVLALVRKLEDESPDEREKASQALLARGPAIVPLLRQTALRAPQVTGGSHATAFAEKCQEAFGKDALPPLPRASTRLLALRRPEGTLAALLAFVPFADNDETADRVRELIADLGFQGGQPDPLLVKALQDPVGARRAVAARLVGRPELGHLPAIRKLLEDADPEVRAAAALALANLGERQAVPTLIALLADLPIDRTWAVEEYLQRLAGDDADAMPITSDPAERQKSRDRWARWWAEKSSRVQMPRPDGPAHLAGLLLVVEQYNVATRSGSVAELDRAGKVRWKITPVQGPQYAEVLSGQRVLIAEYNTGRVTERDLTGKIVWEKAHPVPFFCQRLRNGHTFIGGRNQIAEVDPAGKEVFRYLIQNETILAVRRAPDGHTDLITYQGSRIRLDTSGKEVKRSRWPANLGFGIGGAEILPGERILVSIPQTGQVLEYDAQGRTVWEAKVPQAGTPTRLPDGHTLVVAQGNTRVVELDRAGKIVSELKELASLRPWRVSKR